MPFSSIITVEDMICRPRVAAHTAVSPLPAPHHTRCRSVGECGVIGSRVPLGTICGLLAAMPFPSIARRNRSVCSRAMSASLPSSGKWPK